MMPLAARCSCDDKSMCLHYSFAAPDPFNGPIVCPSGYQSLQNKWIILLILSVASSIPAMVLIFLN